MGSAKNWIDQIENFARHGLWADLETFIRQQLADEKLQRQDLPKILHCLRRAGKAQKALQIFKKILGFRFDRRNEWSQEERAEYAATLIQVGALSESTQLLDDVDAQIVPRKHLYKALGLFRLWKYDEAIPHLEQFITLSSGYEQAVGKINLTAATIVTGDFLSAKRLLGEIAALIQDRGYKTLELTIQDLIMQLWTKQGHFESTHNLVAELRTEHDLPTEVFQFKIAKREFFEKCQTQPSEVTKEDFNLLKRRAWEFKDWDGIRECDYFFAKVFKSSYFMTKVYFGSPYPLYRKKIEEDFLNFSPEGSSHFVLRAPRNEGHLHFILDLETGEVEGCDTKYVLEGLILKLIDLLTEDFYRPVLLGEAYHRLYPGEFYDFSLAKNRIFNLIQRTNEISQTQNFGYLISTKDSEVRLRLGAAFGVRRKFSENINSKSRSSVRLATLQKHFGLNVFTTTEAASVLNLAASQVTISLQDGLKSGLIEKLGAGRSTRYRFPNPR